MVEAEKDALHRGGERRPTRSLLRHADTGLCAEPRWGSQRWASPPWTGPPSCCTTTTSSSMSRCSWAASACTRGSSRLSLAFPPSLMRPTLSFNTVNWRTSRYCQRINTYSQISLTQAFRFSVNEMNTQGVCGGVCHYDHLCILNWTVLRNIMCCLKKLFYNFKYGMRVIDSYLSFI